MIRKAVLIIVTTLLLCSCSILKSFTQTETKVVSPNGEVWLVVSKGDSHVVFQDGKVILEVDNRGKPGTVEEVLKLLMLRSEIIIGSGERQKN